MKSDEQALIDDGWTIECESPFEIRHSDGSFATGQAAHMVVSSLHEEELLEKYETMIDRYSDEEVLQLMWGSFHRGYYLSRESSNLAGSRAAYIDKLWEIEVQEIFDIMNQKPVKMYE